MKSNFFKKYAAGRWGICFLGLAVLPWVAQAQSSETMVINAITNANSEAAVKPESSANNIPPLAAPGDRMSSAQLVGLSWEASGKNDLDKVMKFTGQCAELYGAAAQTLESQLPGFPERGEEKKYQALNDVGVCLFIRAEALMNNGRGEEAKEIFQKIISQYKWAQGWDPSRGSFWSVAEKSRASLDVLTGARTEEPEVEDKNILRTVPTLRSKGKESVVDHRRYGKFTGIGTKDYRYDLTDPQGLAEAVGEGIYPNIGSIQSDPNYKKVKSEGRLEGSHWDFVYSEDLEAALYKWLTAPEPMGVKLFYTGLIFEKAKMYEEAVKTYQALIVHFPQAVAWTYWHTPWYPAQAALAKIQHIIRKHPELNLKYEGAKIQVVNGFDNDITNDIIITNPGIMRKKGMLDGAKGSQNKGKSKVALKKIRRTLGGGEVRLVQYANHHWQLLVKDKPYVIKGITYAPTKIGQSPDKGTLVNWMTSDVNKNGKPDGPYDAWVDANKNEEQDADEPVVGDFYLMKKMGVNTIREYHQPFEPDKKILRDLYETYGIRVIMGDFLGKYTFGSGATWYEGTDYENPEHQKKMLESVKKMVLAYKDEPYILMWLLGNENNYGVACNADKKPEAYYKFVNEAAKLIKSLDKNHPVAVGNGDTLYLDIFAKNAPDVDIFGANVYRGDYGFGSFWEQVADATGKPAFITEYGAPAYTKHMTPEQGEQAQADYHEGNWLDIEANTAGRSDGVGNALGGVAFEWVDEWWKNYEPFFHDKKSDAIGPFPGGYYYEEWFGLTSQGKGRHSPFLRQLRKSYFLYKDLWKE